MKPGLTDVGLFVFRAPLLPVAAFQQLNQPPGGKGANRWRAPLDQPHFRTAIALQSPSLLAALDRPREGAADRRDPGVALPLYRYASRAALGCTPRGLFAAAGIGRITARTDLRFGGPSGTGVRIELSLDYLGALLHQQLALDGGLRGVRLAANPTLVRYGDTISLWEASGAGDKRVARQVALRGSALLQRVVGLLGTKARTAARVRALLQLAGVPAEQRDMRIAELLSAQILVPDVGVCTISTDPVGQVIARLPKGGPWADTRRALAAVHARRDQDWGSPCDLSLTALETLREGLPAVPGFEHVNQVFQVETQLHSHSIALNKKVVAEVRKAIERLYFAFADMHAERLVPLVDAFTDRFGEATVPLLRVLDAETGLGAVLSAAAPVSRWARRGRRPAMLRLLHGALERRQRVVELDESFWDAIAAEDLPALPPALSAVCRIVAESETDVDAGAYEIVLDCVVGTAGTELWSRHARLSDRIRAGCEELRRRLPVDGTGAVRADVSFTPIRGADIMSRPALEKLRIECSVAARMSGTRGLPLAELYVQVRNGRIRLVSKRVTGEIVPVIGSAVDPATVHAPVFTFLALVASQQGATPLVWDWGELSDSPFLPRVCLGKVTLAPARWRVDRAELRSLRRAGADADALARWAQWRAQRNLPRWVSIRSGEDGLGCDLDRAIGLELLWKEVTHNAFAIVEELRIAPGELCVSDGTQRYAHELVVPFVREADSARPSRGPIRRERHPSIWAAKFDEGVRLPGSDWVYAKLYGSPRRLQSMLRREVPALIARLRRECQIEEWFFFRYQDPDWHLRLRARASRRAQHARVRELIESTCRSLQANEAIWRLQYDTYFREVERFGGRHGCRFVEQVFCAESEMALRAFGTWTDDETFAVQGMRFAVGWTWWVWTRLGLVPAEVAQLSRTLRVAMLRHHHVSRAYQKSANQAHPLEPLTVNEGAWRACSLRAGKALERIRALADAQTLGVGLHELAGDLPHLLVNRLFPALHVEREYDLCRSLEWHARHTMLAASDAQPARLSAERRSRIHRRLSHSVARRD